MTNDYKEGTTCNGNDVTIDKRESIATYNPIKVVSSSNIKFDPNFKAYLTFFIYGKDTTIDNLIEELKNEKEMAKKSTNAKEREFYIQNMQLITKKIDDRYFGQMANPKNIEGKLIPVSYSFDLIKALKREGHPLDKHKIHPFNLPSLLENTKGNKELLKNYVYKDNEAKIKIVRKATPKDEILPVYDYGDIGIKDLYDKFAVDRTIEGLVNTELTGVSRDQFEIGVPVSNPSVINILSPDPLIPFYSVIRFSDKYTEPMKGFRPGKARSGQIIEIAKNDLDKLNDKVVVGFGNFIGPVDETNPKRRFLMYLTPNELIPKL